MKRFLLCLAALITIGAWSTLSLADSTAPQKSSWGQVKVIYRSPAAVPTDADVTRAATILSQDNPNQSDLDWMESLTLAQRQSIMERLPSLRPQLDLQDMALNRPGESPAASSAYWVGEWSEKQTGGGSGCYANAFWNSPSGQCGKPGEFPPDKVYSFPCSNLANKSSIRIYSTNWQVNWMLGSGVSARVFADHVEICVGYWSLYWTGTNPYTVLGTTYIYWR